MTDEEPKPMLPMVHLNGTSIGQLIEGYQQAALAVTSAVRALTESAPNGRDYYPMGEQAMHRALTEYMSRLSRLVSVEKELTAIYAALVDMEDERRRNRQG